MKFSYQFDPLSDDPNNIEITADGVPFLKTASINNAEMVCEILNGHNKMVESVLEIYALSDVEIEDEAFSACKKIEKISGDIIKSTKLL